MILEKVHPHRQERCKMKGNIPDDETREITFGEQKHNRQISTSDVTQE